MQLVYFSTSTTTFSLELPDVFLSWKNSA